MNRSCRTYQRMAITTADPLQTVVLLYEGAIKDLHRAARAIASDAETAAVSIHHALEIIRYLQASLDHHQGGEIAFNLDRLYAYMRDALAEANIRREAGKLHEVIALLQTLLDGWRGIQSGRATPPPNETPADRPASASTAGNVSAVVG